MFIKLVKENLLKLKLKSKLWCCLLCIIGLVSTSNIYADLKDPKNISLVYDNINNIKNYSKPKKYRNGLDLYSLQLNISGSAQPNLKDFEYIIAKAKQIVKNYNKIFLVDLRQEPHALLNDNAVSWFGFRNQVSNTLEQDLILQLSLLKTAKVCRVVDKLEDGVFMPKHCSSVAIHKVITEQQAVEGLGVKYQRFIVTDHFAPNDEQVDLFVQFMKKLPSNSWVHFHCRGGHGRTTTFMVLYDIINNAHLLSLNDILERQHNLSGTKLSTTQFKNIRKKWKEPAATARYSFIKKFYKYVLDPKGYIKCNWSEWVTG